MKITQPRIASGFPEYSPEEQLAFNHLLAIVRNTYELYGFTPIETPQLELKEVLLAKGGGETDKQVYELQRGKNNFCLPFDLTLPLARYVAERQGNLVFPFRRYQIAKVHRAERAQAGRYREFYQCDIDVIGSNNPYIDGELTAVINQIFEAFQIGEFTIQINDRKLLNGFFKTIGYQAEPTPLLRLIDKLAKISSEEFAAELQKLNLTSEQVKQLQDFMAIQGTNSEVLAALSDLAIANEEFQAGLINLQEIYQVLQDLNLPESRFQFNLSITRGLDYYTGTVYETFLDEYPQLGSICSGGRYDDLLGHFSKTPLPGVGISIGLSRLFYQLLENKLLNISQQTKVAAVILPYDQNSFSAGLKLASLLRSQNLPVIFYSEATAFKKKMRYADRLKVPFSLIIGEDEIEKQTVSVKDMRTGETAEIAETAVVNYLQEKLKEVN